MSFTWDSFVTMLNSSTLSLPVCLSGPPDRRSEYIQRHPEELGCVQAARGPGLSAAPVAVAVVLRPARPLLGERLVASPLHSNKPQRTDKHTFV